MTLYQFSGTAGSTILLDALTDSNSNAGYGDDDVTLFDQYGNSLYTGNLNTSSGRLTLSSTGTYTLVVQGSLSDTGTTSYSFDVQPVNLNNPPALWGTSGNDAITVQYLNATSRDVYLNGYLEGTVVGSTPLLINGEGGADTVNVVGPSGLAYSSATPFTVEDDQVGATSQITSFLQIGTLLFDGAGTSGTPQILEATSVDKGATAAGFVNNQADSSIDIAAGTYVRLSPSATVGGTAAVYVDTLTVTAGSTLDLDGLHLYATSMDILGNVVNGTVSSAIDFKSAAATLMTPGIFSSFNVVTSSQPYCYSD